MVDLISTRTSGARMLTLAQHVDALAQTFSPGTATYASYWRPAIDRPGWWR